MKKLPTYKNDANSKPKKNIREQHKMEKDDNLNIIDSDWINKVFRDGSGKMPSFFEITHHKENLFSQRFNVLVLSYSLFVTAFASLQDFGSKAGKLIILGLAFIVIALLSISVYRSYIRFDIIMKMVYKIDKKNNPYCLIQEEFRVKRKGKHQTNWIMGWGIPLVFVASILVAFIFVLIS